MEESSTLKLIIEKGPREGETLEYSSRSVVKIGRVVRGNTIGIKDAGISSKHISIQFDSQSSKWNLTDLDSSNGTILNGERLSPNVPSALKDGDCIKIGELTSIIVKIEEVQSTIGPQRNPRRQGRAAAVDVVEREQNGLGLGFDGDFGKKEAEEPAPKRNLRPRAKKAVDSKDDAENLNSMRTLRSSKKEQKVSSIPTLNQIPEYTNADVKEATDQIVPIERKVTRGRPKKLQVQLPNDPDLDPVDGKKTRRGRNRLPVEPLKELQISESVNASENVLENRAFDLETNNESSQDHVAEKLVSTYEDCERKEAMVDESLAKEAFVQVHVDKGNDMPDGFEGSVNVKESGVDTSRWQDLEKMTLGDFFDYLEWYLPKEIREKTEEIISQLPEKARTYHEVRRQHEKGKGKQAMD